MSVIKPLWQWRPTWLRRLVLPLYLMGHAASVVIVLVIVLVWIAIAAAWEEFAHQWPDRRDRATAWVWIRATWNGEHVGKALMDHINRAESNR